MHSLINLILNKIKVLVKVYIDEDWRLKISREFLLWSQKIVI